MRLIIQPDYQSVSSWAAHYVAAKIKAANPTAEKPFVLGCPTGSSPLGMYKGLIDLNKKGIVSFENVVTFNMDEYVGCRKNIPKVTTLSCGITSLAILTSNRKTRISLMETLLTWMLNVPVMKKK